MNRIIDPVWLRSIGVDGHDIHILKEDIQAVVDLRPNGGPLKVHLRGGASVSLHSKASEDIKNEILDYHFFKHEKLAQKERDLEGYVT